MKQLYKCVFLLMCCFGLLAAPLVAEDASASIVLATTTSTQQTGLLDILLPAFTKATGIIVKPVAVGTGKALDLGKKGDADVVMVHARKLEDAFVAEGYGKHPWDLMFNDFVLLGPASDPAQVTGSPDVKVAMQKIASAATRFVSRADKSGTHEKEIELWALAGVKKTGEAYVQAGQGMAETLLMAGEMQAYTLCDRATWISARTKNPLVIVFENPQELKNPYGVIAVDNAKVKAAKTDLAIRFIDWLVGNDGQQIIKEFKMDGETLFHLSVGKR